MKTYRGTQVETPHGFEPDIFVAETDRAGVRARRLDPRDGKHGGTRLANHSPDGFAWGYNGSGPSQAACAILADCMGDRVALHHYHAFRERVLARFDTYGTWQLTEAQVRAVVAELEAERPLPPEET
jgi:hypothetical protein